VGGKEFTSWTGGSADKEGKALPKEPVKEIQTLHTKLQYL
jgi:hypothetical protein